jgi:hypothetical protein
MTNTTTVTDPPIRGPGLRRRQRRPSFDRPLQAPHVARIQAAGTRSVRARLRSVAGCAPSTGSAGPAGVTADLELTFNTDHSVGAITPCSTSPLRP